MRFSLGTLAARLLVLASLCMAIPAMAQDYLEPMHSKPYFREHPWFRCGDAFLPQVKALNQAALGEMDIGKVQFYWLDFSPIQRPYDRDSKQFRTNLPDFFVPGTVDVYWVTATEHMRFYIQRPEELTFFPQALVSRKSVYQDLLGQVDKSKAPGIGKVMTQVEDYLELPRLDVGYVETSENGGGLLSAIRTYDATDAQVYRDYSPDGKTDFRSPAEIAYDLRGLNAWSIKKLRLDFKGWDFVEVGSWLNSYTMPNGRVIPRAERLKSKLIQLKMLREKVLMTRIQAGRKTKYIFHVANEDLADSYRRDYGAKDMQRDQIAGSPGEVEILQVVDDVVFARELQKRIDEILEEQKQ